MALHAGMRLGPYEVLSLLGTGGMGEVYEALDTRLGRPVAVKVLAPELARDAEFRDRFAREARAVSALNHPHICGLFDVGREHDTEYLVLELLQGETLAARLARGPLPIAQVLRFAIEIADALEAAHTKGIVHRDLKPGNVMLTAAGTKLLDFGLAKHTTGPIGDALSMLATAPGTGTSQGTIVGTLQYMAPEQVQGLPADTRTDIFALGTLLYEMATGCRAFQASTQASVIAKILETEPARVSSIVPVAPPALDHIVQGCLAKAPADRWQAAHDVKLQLQWVQAQGSAAGQTRPELLGQSSKAWVPWTMAAVLCAALVATGLRLWSPRAASPAMPARFDLTLPRDVVTDVLVGIDRGAISPDGQHFVFTATVDGRTQLVLRSLNSAKLVVLPGTDNAFNPFWSPDSRLIAFFAGRGQLETIPVTGGRPRVLGEAGEIAIETSGTWGAGVILFGPRDGRIYRIADAGGPASPLSTLPWKTGQKSFVAPRFLPDGRHFTLNVSDDPALYLAATDTQGTRKLLDDASSVAYAGGYLFYARGASLYARRFDATRLGFSGDEVPVTSGGASFSVSDQGSIAYRPEHVSTSSVTWFDRTGRQTGTVGEPGPYQQVALSPGGGQAILVRGDTGNGDLWQANLATGVFSRLTTNAALDSDPSWSPDERAVAFTSFRTDRAAVFVKDLVAGTESPLVHLADDIMVDQWTADGRFIIFRKGGGTVYAVSLSGDRTPRLLNDAPFTQDEVHVSPDGQWVAFDADESGRWEVYLAAFPGFTSKRQLSNGGGVQPQWRADGRELFYLRPDGSMMSVRVDTRPEFAASPPVKLFPTNIVPIPDQPQYGVTSDGQRFLGLERVGGTESFTFLLNWLSEISTGQSSAAQ